VSFADGFAFLGEDLGPISTVDRMRSMAKKDVAMDRALYVTVQGAYLSLRHGQIVVNHGENELLAVPVAFVNPIVLFGSVGLTAGLRTHALAKGINVSFMSRRGRWMGRLDGGTGHRPALRRAQYRKSENSAERLHIAKGFVDGKISNMRALLLRYAQRNGIPRIIGAAKQLVNARAAINTVTTVNELLGVEGAASAVYFGALTELFAPRLGFDGRNRRPPRDVVNAALSYGYEILNGEVAAAIHQHGLDPACGFLHVDDDRPSLALDMMEEFRPVIVDAAIVELFRRRQLTEKDITSPESGGVWLSREGVVRLIEAIEARLTTEFAHLPSRQRTTYRRAIGLQVRQVGALVLDQSKVYEPVRWRR
jgi:CRISP-associated protein Cas1